MKSIALTLTVVLLAGCSVWPNRTDNPYEEAPFYAQFLNTGSNLDLQIQQTLAALRENPDSTILHNQLGALLMQKDFPRDAEREFERAINFDSHFFPAWYNLGVVRMSQGNFSGARRAFRHTVRLRKGHSAALYQLGLMEEKEGDTQQAVWYYAKAFRHNPAMLDVRVNPSLLDSKLTHLALLKRYELERSRRGAAFEPAYAGYEQPREQEAPSPEAAPQDIVTPAPPATEQGTQKPPSR